MFFGWAQMGQLKWMRVNVWLCSVQKCSRQQSQAQRTAWHILTSSPCERKAPSIVQHSSCTFTHLKFLDHDTVYGSPKTVSHVRSRCSGCWALAREWRLQVRSDSDHVTLWPVKPSVYVSPPDVSSFLGAVALSFVC